MSIIINAPQFTCGVLRAKWSKPVVAAELLTSYELVLDQALKSGKCRFWLLDLSQRNWSEPTLLNWLSQQFAARASQALGGPVFVAYLTASHHWVHVGGSGLTAMRQRAAKVNFYSCFFKNGALALDWLRDQRQLEPTAVRWLNTLN
ncbi:hypothetical protein GO988_13805 [Hymenobacter sp. HMF4947]|uniref:STAS/SEC14 domain-containing protein n=1 Tax=Hymenobacter ginkgonis TaxID=2682976 RepID=A0A7K1TG73_9BACT|nr:hypothetical protein [Hymenobacter ginkgonis]MVN77405.1 hypothetical protein [Hymenobacter ginkgonis]